MANMARQRSTGRIMRMAAERRAATLVVRLTTAKTWSQPLDVALPRLRVPRYDRWTVSLVAIDVAAAVPRPQ